MTHCVILEIWGAHTDLIRMLSRISVVAGTRVVTSTLYDAPCLGSLPRRDHGNRCTGGGPRAIAARRCGRSARPCADAMVRLAGDARRRRLRSADLLWR